VGVVGMKGGRGRSIFAAGAILFVFWFGRASAGGLKDSTETIGGPLASIADATCNSTVSQIVPADTSQSCAILSNNGSNPARIGDSLCGASQCAELPSGAPPLKVCTTGPIYCFSASGTTIGITKIEQ
jgi:hypothetical protein